MGVQLLRNTRRNHLIEDCALRDDPGALAFLMHQSMTGQVQSDSYRSFTDPTGQQYLYSKLCRDRHGCPAPEKENTRTSIVRPPDGRQEIRIPPVSGSSRQGDALITLVLTMCSPEMSSKPMLRADAFWIFQASDNLKKYLSIRYVLLTYRFLVGILASENKIAAALRRANSPKPAQVITHLHNGSLRHHPGVLYPVAPFYNSM